MAQQVTSAKTKTSKVPAKKVVTKNSAKFKRKNADGTTGRKGRKIQAVWIDSSYLVDLLTKGMAPRVVLKLVRQAIARFDEKAFASIIHTSLGDISEEKRSKLLKRYFPKPKLSAEDRKALSAGRKVLRIMKG